MSNAGRPAKFTTVEALETKIEEYFEYIKGEFKLVKHKVKINEETKEPEFDDVIKWVRRPEYPAITGLALFLGFESRQSILDYENRGEFSGTIKRARTKIEMHYEQRLNSTNPTGSIFALKNFGWSDQAKIDHTTNGKDVNSELVFISSEHFSKEELNTYKVKGLGMLEDDDSNDENS